MAREVLTVLYSVFSVVGHKQMKITKRHRILISAILVIYSSLLFYGRDQSTYMLMSITGSLTAVISMIATVADKFTSWKHKLYWVIFAAGSVMTLELVSPILIKGSYIIYIYDHESELNILTKLLESTEGEIYIFGNEVDSRDPGMEPIDTARLSNLSRSLGSQSIWSSDSTIYVELYGMLDVRLGIRKSIKGKPPPPWQREITDGWYY